MQFHQNHLRLSATDLAKHLACRHATSLDLSAATGKLEKPSWYNALVVILQKRGFRHEAAYLQHLGTNGHAIAKRDESVVGREAVQWTLDALRSGVPIVVQASLQNEAWHGFADVLLRVERPKRYVAESSAWATVTPVLLPGHDDPGGLHEKLRRGTRGEEQKLLIERLMQRREALVRKALRHAGLGDELAFTAEIETRKTGFIAGVEKASLYAVPSHLAQSPRLHVKLTWPVKVAGPLCIGRGRFSGLGLFTAIE